MIVDEILQWITTAFFLTGAFVYTGKSASNPKIRMYGFCLYIIGGNYAFAVTQMVFECIDVRGVINCLKEMKNNTIEKNYTNITQ